MRTKGMRAVAALLFFCTLLLRPAWAQNTLTLYAESCFSGMTPQGVYPIVVTVRNQGPSVDGAVLVRSESFTDTSRRLLYPLSLPTGTIKRILAYPVLEPYTSKVTVSFIGPARARPHELLITPRGEGAYVGLIGDQIGGLAMIRPFQTGRPSPPNMSPGTSMGQGVPFSDCYARPEDAPDRAAGYQGLRTLVLSEGAERMTSAQWAAIRQWVIGGGSLMLLGGASAPYLLVPEAQSLLPLRNWAAVTVSHLRLPLRSFGQLPAGRTALLTGVLKPGASALARQDGHIVLASMPLGAGMVLYAAFNPLEEPFRRWEGLGRLWAALARWASPTVEASMLRGMEAERQPGYYYSGGPMSPMGSLDASRDPFRVRLPSSNTVMGFFLAYFILVVPVTYFVLKGLRRLEWAWVTGPLLSVAFAYGFYLFTADLYRAGLSRRTIGSVLAVAGEREARFAGYSELFFPRAGSYRLQIPNAETMELSESGSYYAYRSSPAQIQALETVDTGTVEAPAFSVGNLAFRRIYHTQSITLEGAITATLRRSADGKLIGTVRNGTGQELVGAWIVLPNQQSMIHLGSLKPGESKSMGEGRPFSRNTVNVGGWNMGWFRLQAQHGSCAFLLATLTGEPFGPPLGRYVGGASAVRLLVSLPIAEGSR